MQQPPEAAASAPLTNPGQARMATLAVLAVLAATLVLRLVHLAAAVRSPLTFQPGPDEDYYWRFGQAVAAGAGNDPLWAFMDPGYGYLLGALIGLGANTFGVYAVQIVLDTATAACLILIGREFGRPLAGLCAAALYAVTATAILFCTTLLKATWVASFMALWMWLGLVLLRTRAPLAWLGFGVLCGWGIALRSNLLLMAAFALVLLPWLDAPRPSREGARKAGLLLAGLLVPLALLAWRNAAVAGTASPLPTNGGVVLHQLYNAGNPRAISTVPDFVPYMEPVEIWLAYAREAQRRTGRAMTPAEVSGYWRAEAVAYLRDHPAQTARNIGRKLLQFVAYTEVANNRALAEERLFSPLLAMLPSPFGWLLALGAPGLALLLARDRRALVLLAPVACTLVTVTVFFPEDRFRFHAVPALAVGAGLFLETLYGWLRGRRLAPLAAGVAGAALIGGASVALARQIPAPGVTWTRIVLGYLRMGELDAARDLAIKVAADNPTNATVFEALGAIASARGDPAQAAGYLRRAVSLKPDSHVAQFNLARALRDSGDRAGAASAAAAAMRLSPRPEYAALLAELGAAPAAPRP
jgi:tetratricopeptide (TPR) repeat protein